MLSKGQLNQILFQQITTGGKVEDIQFLLEHGAQVNARLPEQSDHSDDMPDVDRVEALQIDDQLKKIAMQAASSVAEQVHINAQNWWDKFDKYDATPLKAAIVFNRPDIVELLLRKGAKISHDYREMATAIEKDRYYPTAETFAMFKMLFRHMQEQGDLERNYPLLAIACDEGNPRVLRYGFEQNLPLIPMQIDDETNIHPFEVLLRHFNPEVFDLFMKRPDINEILKAVPDSAGILERHKVELIEDYEGEGPDPYNYAPMNKAIEMLKAKALEARNIPLRPPGPAKQVSQ